MASPGNRLWYLSLLISALLNAAMLLLLAHLTFPASKFRSRRARPTIRVEVVGPRPKPPPPPRPPNPAPKPPPREVIRPANPLPPSSHRRTTQEWSASGAAPAPRTTEPVTRSGGSRGGGSEGTPAPAIADSPGAPPPSPAVMTAPVFGDFSRRPDHLPPIPAYASDDSPPSLKPEFGGSTTAAGSDHGAGSAPAIGTGEGSGPGVGTGTGSGPGPGPGSGNGSTSGSGAGVGPGAAAGSTSGSGAGDGIFGVGAGAGAGPRHIVYLLDVSPSMESRIDRARQELRNALATLQPGESFDVVEFSGSIHPFEHTLTPVTPDTIAEANRFLDSVKLSPATNLERAVTAVLGMRGLNVIVIITDGVPTLGQTNFDKLAQEIRARNRTGVRIFTIGLVGIDPGDPTAPDQTFEATRLLEQIARDSGGSFRLVPLGTPDRG